MEDYTILIELKWFAGQKKIKRYGFSTTSAVILLITSIGLFLAFKDEELGIIVVGMLCFVVGFTLWTYCLHTKGVKDGAYNQLRGKYEVNYVIDKDSCITDTIINIK